MKKNMSVLIVICLICVSFFSIILSTQAIDTLEISTGGTASKVTYKQEGNVEEIRIFSSSTKIVNQYLIMPEGSIENYRLCLEIENVDVSRTIRFDINKGSVVQVRLANMSSPKRTNVVIETNTKPNYNINTAADGKSIIITLGKGSSSNQTPSPSATPAPSAKPSPSPSATPAPSAKPSPSPSATPAPSNPSNQNNGGNDIANYGPLSWIMSGDSCILTLDKITLTQTKIGSNPRFELRENEKMIQITLPGKDTRFKEGYLSGNSVIYGILVNYNTKHNCTIIRICYSNTITYSHTVSGGSSVFVINSGSKSVNSDLPTPPSESPIASPKPSNPAPAPSSKPTPTPAPSASPTPTPTQPPIEDTEVPSNLKAGDGDGNTIVRLTGQSIISKFHTHKDKIIVDEAKDKSSVTFMMPINITNLGSGTLSLNDSVATSVSTFTTDNYTFLTVSKNNPNTQFDITVGVGTNELILVQTKDDSKFPDSPTSPASKLVVIDPGHGGSDPGTVYGPNEEYEEKKYNLDIALRCQTILKAYGVNVAMTRTTDRYVSLEDRTIFANDRNATLFVSIHNNSMPDGYKGSMTLYYPTSYKGKDYARIVQKNLIADLNTNDIGVKGDGLYVLKYTKMPAVLAEVVCMSDNNDLVLINDSAFIQKSAESLARSIIEILSLN